MADDAIIKFPDGTFVHVVDPDEIVPAYVDLISEFREVDDVIYLSLASFIIDGDEGGKKARVVSRLRIPKAKAAVLYGLVGNLLAKPKTDPASETVN